MDNTFYCIYSNPLNSLINPSSGKVGFAKTVKRSGEGRLRADYVDHAERAELGQRSGRLGRLRSLRAAYAQPTRRLLLYFYSLILGPFRYFKHKFFLLYFPTLPSIGSLQTIGTAIDGTTSYIHGPTYMRNCDVAADASAFGQWRLNTLARAEVPQ
jgi:hypothetical protein